MQSTPAVANWRLCRPSPSVKSKRANVFSANSPAKACAWSSVPGDGATQAESWPTCS